ncbi:MAG: hypothetical protein ACSHWQ_06645 [Spongiibacteraceae bacterium]
MSTSFDIPSNESVSSMLAMLYGSDIETVTADDNVVDGSYVARFIDDNGALVGACICDPQFIGFSGAALSMIPKGGAEDMIEENDFSTTVMENFYEVMNICTTLLMTSSKNHLKLDDTLPYADVAGDLAALDASSVVSFSVEIPKYGKGKMIYKVT